jgi:hypothetical protein
MGQESGATVDFAESCWASEAQKGSAVSERGSALTIGIAQSLESLTEGELDDFVQQSTARRIEALEKC